MSRSRWIEAARPIRRRATTAADVALSELLTMKHDVTMRVEPCIRKSEIRLAAAAAAIRLGQSFLMFGAHTRAIKNRPHGGHTVLKPRPGILRTRPNSASPIMSEQKRISRGALSHFFWCGVVAIRWSMDSKIGQTPPFDNARDRSRGTHCLMGAGLGFRAGCWEPHCPRARHP